MCRHRYASAAVPGPVQSIERAAAILRLLARGSGRLGRQRDRGLARPGPRAPRTASCARSRASASSSRTTRPASTGSARPCCTSARATSTSTSCGPARSTGPTRWPPAAARRYGSARRSTARCSSSTTSSGPTTPCRPSTSARCCRPHATALGKVLLAYDAGAAAALSRHVSSRSPGGRSPSARELTPGAGRGTRQGWAARDRGVLTVGEAGVAAPIRGQGGLVVGAIGIRGAGRTLCDAGGRPSPTLVTYVRDAARAVSRDLGASRW